MSAEWNEKTLSQQPALELLKKFGYTHLTPAEVRGRRSELRSPFLPDLLEAAIVRLNPWISDENRARALEALTLPSASGLLEAAEACHTLLTRGLSLPQEIEGVRLGRTVRFIDFENPENNVYHVTEEFPVRGTQHTREFDLALFVNGIPLAYLECKSPLIHAPLREAKKQLELYQELGDKQRFQGVPQAFYSAQILAVVCREQAEFGAVGARGGDYAPFPETYPLTLEECTLRYGLDTPTVQDVLLYSLLEPINLLEYTRFYVVFEVVRGQVVKKLARWQQRVAVEETLRRVRGRRQGGENLPKDRVWEALEGQLGRWELEAAGDGGVIWHTQGSGKSLTMVWLAQRLRQGLPGNPTLVIVSDRRDLDLQTSSTFRRAGFPSPERAQSRAHLRELLETSAGRTLFTTVQKFYSKEDAVLNRSSNILVLVDEAHRSQYEQLASKMRYALPGALFVGFTGTPIDQKHRSTFREFGPYIHKYTMPQAVRDGATLPIFYESRLVELHVEKRLESDEPLRRIFPGKAESDYEAMKRKYATLETLAAAPSRVDAVVLDLLNHYQQQIEPNGFKAMIVCPSKAAAQTYFEKLELYRGPECVVIYDARPDEAHYLSKADEDRILERFLDDTDPLKLLIVVDRLLTGFDAPVLQVMYLDKPLKEHTLLQAIARVNRTFGRLGKDRGYVVDYWGVTDHLARALEGFEDEDVRGLWRQRKDEVQRLNLAHRGVLSHFQALGLGREHLERHLRLLEDESQRREFEDDLREFSRWLSAVYPNPEALQYVEDFKWLQELRALARIRFEREETPDFSEVAPKLRQLIQDSIHAGAVEQLVQPLSIFAPNFEEALRRLPEDAQASEMIHAIQHEIGVKLPENPSFYLSIKARLEQILEARRNNLHNSAELVTQLLPLRQDILEAPRSREAELGLTPNALAFYDALEPLGLNGQTPEVARRIEQILSAHLVLDWTEKEDVQREMRRNLRRVLREAQVSGPQAEELITAFMGIARARMRR